MSIGRQHEAVLIIDDTIANLDLLAALLKDEGYAVRASASAELALQSAKNQPPALILLDIVMPDMDGFEVCRRLKQDTRTCDIPVIFISAQGDVASKVQGFSVGGVDYINKPFQREEVLARVCTHLALRDIQNQLELRVKERTAELEQNVRELRIAATVFESQQGMVVTDANVNILRINNAFTQITGFSGEDVAGKNPRILSSGQMDESVFSNMWENLNSTGTWSGEIWNRRKSGEVYPEYLTITAVKDGNDVVTNYVGTFTDISKRKAADEKIQHLAYYDTLTDLPNRQLLFDRLQLELISTAHKGRTGALLMIDLDNFKIINDSLGHDIGDLLLKQVAQRITSCVSDFDTVSRIGGDEFVVMLVGLSGNSMEASAQAQLMGEKILAALSQTFKLGLYNCHTSSSIGITLLGGNEYYGDELFKQADIAMFQAKKAGRNTICIFDPQMQEAINIRADIEDELRRAIDGMQFQVHYQVQVDSSCHPLGAETLIRWIHPQRGMVSPLKFIPLAEETGLILPIGQWVLDTACAQIKTWQRDTLTRDLVLAVNVSAKQFHQADFIAQVKATVERHDINPQLLKLELTEGMLVENMESTIENMHALKQIGVKFSLDDFGTGYSSLQYLKRLPLDQLKIDQSFVRDLVTDNSDREIVKTIIVMAHSLNLNVIAEGVETIDQANMLLSYGCKHYQGYLYSKPLPIGEFEALLIQLSKYSEGEIDKKFH